jgi:hypothetical protein
LLWINAGLLCWCRALRVCDQPPGTADLAGGADQPPQLRPYV